MTSAAHELAARTAAYLFEHDQASRNLGIKLLEIGPGRAKLAMRVRADMLNGHGACHRGILFTFADSAFAFACNSYDRTTVAAAATIDFLMPVQADAELTATAVQLWRARRMGLYEVTLLNERATPVALFRGRSYELHEPLLKFHDALTP